MNDIIDKIDLSEEDEKLKEKLKELYSAEIKFDYDDVIKVDPDAPCDIEAKGE